MLRLSLIHICNIRTFPAFPFPLVTQILITSKVCLLYTSLWDYAEKHHIKIEGLAKPKSDISEGEEEEAVSYTHLDVYKRQVYCCCLRHPTWE